MALLDGKRPTLVAPVGATGRDIWHALPGAQVFDALGGTPSGLTEAEAKKRLVRTGPDRYVSEHETAWPPGWNSAKAECVGVINALRTLVIIALAAADELKAERAHRVPNACHSD